MAAEENTIKSKKPIKIIKREEREKPVEVNQEKSEAQLEREQREKNRDTTEIVNGWVKDKQARDEELKRQASEHWNNGLRSPEAGM